MNIRFPLEVLSSLSSSSKFKLILIIFLTFLSALFDLLYILIPSTILSRFISSERLITDAFDISSLNLTFLVILFLLALSLATFLRCFCISFIARSSASLANEITLSLFRSLISGSYLRFIQYPNSTLKNIFLTQTGQLTSGIINPSLQSFSVLITIITVTLFLFYENPTSTSILFAGAIFIYTVIFVFSKRIVSRQGTIRRKSSNLILSTLSDVFSGFRQIYINSDQSYFINRFSSLNSSMRTAEANSYIAVITPRFIIEYIIIVLLSFFVLFVFRNTNDPISFVAELFTFFFAAQRIFPLLQSFFASVNLVVYSKSTIDDYTNLLRESLSSSHLQSPSYYSNFSFFNSHDQVLFTLSVDSFTYSDVSSPIFTGDFTFYNSSVALIRGPSGSGSRPY